MKVVHSKFRVRNVCNTVPIVSKMTDNLQTVWNYADAVCFDVDSTVIKEEGIDELAKFCNKGNEVAEL